jgi:hypothetical protein
MHPVRRKVEAEELDGDESVTAGVVGPEDGAEGSRADLMQNPVRPESLRQPSATRVRVQSSSSWNRVRAS